MASSRRICNCNRNALCWEFQISIPCPEPSPTRWTEVKIRSGARGYVFPGSCLRAFGAVMPRPYRKEPMWPALKDNRCFARCRMHTAPSSQAPNRASRSGHLCDNGQVEAMDVPGDLDTAVPLDPCRSPLQGTGLVILCPCGTPFRACIFNNNNVLYHII